MTSSEILIHSNSIQIIWKIRDFYVEAASLQWSRHALKKNIFTHIIYILFREKIAFNVVIGLFM